MKKIFLVGFLLWTCLLYSQTSEAGNYEFYTREIRSSAFGYFNTEFSTGNIYQSKISQKGISFTHFYDIWNIGKLPFDTENELSLYLTGEFKIGAATGSPFTVTGNDGIRDGVYKYYSGTLDLFSLFLIPEYTVVMQNGTALRLKFGLHLLNLGASFAFPENGALRKHALATINLFPIGFAPGLFFDFGRTGVGFVAYMNFSDYLSYNIARTDVYGEDLKGLKSFDSIFSRYDFQITFVF